jgi:hypothetical protein
MVRAVVGADNFVRPLVAAEQIDQHIRNRQRN